MCVEISAREIGHVDTRHRLGKVDGRFPHWVDKYEGNRYSVIFYQTRGEEIPRTTAVFTDVPPVLIDPPTFPPKGDRYYDRYNQEINEYEPEDTEYRCVKKLKRK